MHKRTEDISYNSHTLFGALFGYMVHIHMIRMHMDLDKRAAGFTVAKGSLAHTAY